MAVISQASLGNFDTGTIIYGKFFTSSFVADTPASLGGGPVISIYKDGSTTQSTSGVTLTVDFDSVTGLNHFAIDTSANPTFYSSGGQFYAIVTSGAVSLISIAGTVVGQFTLGIGNAKLVRDIWDESLTGATHNVANSSGRRLRMLQDAGGYDDGRVWLNTASANTGSAFPTDGTFLNPVNTLANALTVASGATQQIKRLHVMAGSSVTLASTYSGWNIDGDGYVLALGGQNIGGTVFTHYGMCTGVGTGSNPIFDTGAMGNVTLPPCVILNTGFTATLTVGATGDYLLLNCHSQVPGAAGPTIDMGTAVGATNMNIRRWAGSITFNNIKAGDVVTIDTSGSSIVTVNGTGGTIHIRGWAQEVVDNSSGAVTIYQTSTSDYLCKQVLAVETKTNNLPSSPAATGDTMALTGAAVDSILDEPVEGLVTMRELLRGFAAVLLGKASGLATTTAKYRDMSDTKDRVTATVDANGNRSSVTKDLT